MVKYMKPETTTTTKKEDAETPRMSLVMLFKDCLNQWTKVLPRKSIFC